jgi:hypothetical protein
MHLMVIHLCPSQDVPGSLIFKDAQGDILLGPIPIVTPPAVSCKGSGKPEEGEMQLRVAGVVRMDGATPEDLRAFGRYGIIVLVYEGEAAKGIPSLGEVTSGLFIYGGVREMEETIQCPQNAFRLIPEHHRKLVKLLDKGLHCVVQIVQGSPEEQAGMSRKVAPVPPVSAQIARLAAAAAVVVAPFLVSATASAQSSKCNPYGDGQSFSAVDFSALAARQGGTQYTATVPSSASGVTIAAGVDLGKLTKEALVNMGFNEELVSQYTPYLASSTTSLLTGRKARRVLSANPLVISSGDADETNRLYFTWHANSIGSLFNGRLNALGSNGDFSQLPTQLQTTMTNMFLVDPDFPESDVFDRFSRGDWHGGVKLLKSYKAGNSAAVARAREAAGFLNKTILK